MSERMDFDALDSYLSVNLKNWVARQKQPKVGRERLIQAAAQEQWLEKNVPLRRFYFWWVRPLVPRQAEVWPWGPFTQSRTWSFHMASTRMVA